MWEAQPTLWAALGQRGHLPDRKCYQNGHSCLMNPVTENRGGIMTRLTVHEYAAALPPGRAIGWGWGLRGGPGCAQFAELARP